MRLLFIRQNYPPEQGAFFYTHDLAVDMAVRGHDVTVITALPNYPYGQPYKGFGKFKPDIRIEKGVCVIRLPTIMASNRSPCLRILGFFSFMISSFPWLIFSRRPDIIIASIPPPTVGLLGHIVSKLRKIPIIMMFHDVEPFRSLERRGLIDLPLARFIIARFAKIYNKADLCVVPVRCELQALVSNGVDYHKIKMISHGVDIDHFLNLSRNKSYYLPGSPRRKIALYLGTVGIVHDLETTIRAFGDKAIRDLPVDFLIVGDGERLPRCRKIIDDNRLKNVKLLPAVTVDQVPSVLIQADLLVISIIPGLSVYGSKFLEYLAAGKPILANCTGVLAESVRNEGNGWVFSGADPESLYEALTAFLCRTDYQLSEMGRRGREYAVTRFNAADKHDRWEAIFSALAKLAPIYPEPKARGGN